MREQERPEPTDGALLQVETRQLKYRGINALTQQYCGSAGLVAPH
jgi:hypothetical protein